MLMWENFSGTICARKVISTSARALLLTRCLIVLALVVFATGIPTSPLLANEPPTNITFGGDAAYPPFESLVQGSPSGFNVDLARAIVDMSGAQLDHRLGDWPEIIAALENGEVDVVPMFASAERNQNFLFTAPFYHVNHAIYAGETAEAVYLVQDLTGKRVAVEARSYAHQQLGNRKLDVTPVLTPNTVAALEAVIQGKADYAVLATPVADNLAHRRKLPLRKVGPSFWPAAYVFAVRSDRAELINWLQDALDLAIETGHYQAVYDQWKDQLEPTRGNGSQRAQNIILAVALGLLLLTAIIVAWSWSLRSRVKVRTQELRRALQRAKTAETRALHLSNYDADTGLAKAHQFVNLVDQMLLESDKQAEVIIIKLLQLNEVVKLFGKDYSAELIRKFADKITALSKGPCGYLGRGVFALCSDRNSVQELFTYLSDRWGTEQQSLYSHVIGGSALYPDHGESGAELVQRAETALAVSRAGRRRWEVYSPSMEPDPADLEIVSTFRANQLDGLYAVYQPQVDLRTGRVTGAEALVRWKHPTLGTVAPAKFIPLIEKAGLVSQVTAMMIDEAVRLSTCLRRDGLRSMISVNITISDLTETDLPGVVEKALGVFGGDPGDLKLELTETSVASDFKYVRDVLQRLHEIGIYISVDDFGTGYSSLSYLSFFPIHEVKIDRDFVSDMVTNSRNRSIVHSTILMANELELQTVAEGAEDTATLELLAGYGCDRVQGYVFSRPLPEAEFLAFVQQHNDSSLYHNDVAQQKTRKPG